MLMGESFLFGKTFGMNIVVFCGLAEVELKLYIPLRRSTVVDPSLCCKQYFWTVVNTKYPILVGLLLL